MANLTIWTDFSKRKNSTKQPTGGASVDVKLKENTSIENPVFIVKGLANANYCQYMGNYYFVNDVVFVTNDIVELHCSMDALATNKGQIIGSSQFVKYYTHVNTEITDQRLSAKTTQTTQISTASFSTIGTASASACAYMVTAVGEDSTSVYACTSDVINSLLNADVYDKIANTVDDVPEIEVDESTTMSAIATGIKDTFRFIKDIFTTIVGCIFNSGKMTDYIRNCFVLPLAVGDILGESTEIYLGRVSTTQSGKKVINRIVYDSCTVAIPWQATDWRRNAPYHEIFLNIPFIGLTRVSSSDVIGESSLQILASMDVFSGDLIFKVQTLTNKVIAQYSTNVAVPYAIGVSNIDTSSAMTSLIMGSVAVATGGAGGAVLASAGALGLCNALEPNPACISSNGGGAMLGLNGSLVTCYTIYHNTTVEPNTISAIKGTPYNGVMAIPASGYVECANANIDTIAYGNEKSEIDRMLNSGVYIE